ncbi:MAG: ATP-dependent DNA helicase RecG [Planctomycetes bacterium]|nr:ATP-dependent DNA helicase RecG [Planctomycetota bacterium]
MDFAAAVRHTPGMPEGAVIPALDAPVSSLKGIGPARARALAAAGISDVQDLLLHVPRRHRERLAPVAVRDLVAGARAAIVGAVERVRASRRGRRSLVRVLVADESGAIEVLFFNQHHLKSNFARGETFFFQGRVGERDGVRSLLAEDYERSGALAAPLRAGRVPVYDLPAGVPPRLFRRLIAGLLPALAPGTPDWRARSALPAAGLPSLGAALAALHFPASEEDLAQARRRFAYEEFFRILLPLERARATLGRRVKPRRVAPEPQEVATMLAALPFALTAAQRRALDEVLADLARFSPMHRLLHGDVGSGKTAVALVALAAAARAGHQGALLVPTDVLARQHLATARRFLEPLGVEVELLARTCAAAERKSARSLLSGGAPCVVVGTHALLSASVEIPALALAVVDEQHRFGVSQRARLRSKGVAVDLLVMTATPIPRSLAMTLYGDLDLSLLDELPPGRRVVATRRAPRTELRAVLEEVRADVLRGGRAFIVCPVVGGSEESDLAAAVTFAAKLARFYGGQPAVGLAHGRRRPEENRAALEDFRSGERPVLVATVVVEAGVDVPEATLMVVLDAQRFGLAALHELRGRVGRGRAPAQCILVAGEGSPEANARLDVLVAEANGFKIAEEDLRLRGPGELYGARQHGLLDLCHADLVRDLDLLALARADARRVVESGRDAGLEPHLPRLASVMEAPSCEPGPG